MRPVLNLHYCISPNNVGQYLCRRMMGYQYVYPHATDCLLCVRAITSEHQSRARFGKQGRLGRIHLKVTASGVSGIL